MTSQFIAPEHVLFNFFDPVGRPTLISITISVGQPAGSQKLNNMRSVYCFQLTKQK